MTCWLVVAERDGRGKLNIIEQEFKYAEKTEFWRLKEEEEMRRTHQARRERALEEAKKLERANRIREENRIRRGIISAVKNQSSHELKKLTHDMSVILLLLIIIIMITSPLLSSLHVPSSVPLVDPSSSSPPLPSLPDSLFYRSGKTKVVESGKNEQEKERRREQEQEKEGYDEDFSPEEDVHEDTEEADEAGGFFVTQHPGD